MSPAQPANHSSNRWPDTRTRCHLFPSPVVVGTDVAYVYTYDAASRIKGMTNSAYPGEDFADSVCDATDQLTDVNYSSQTDESYVYDDDRNRVTANPADFYYYNVYQGDNAALEIHDANGLSARGTGHDGQGGWRGAFQAARNRSWSCGARRPASIAAAVCRTAVHIVSFTLQRRVALLLVGAGRLAASLILAASSRVLTTLIKRRQFGIRRPGVTIENGRENIMHRQTNDN
jgi:hypothetical protein